MDWQKEIERFGHLNIDDIGMFAPPREMEQAVSTYNKAVDLLGLDSFDIALIALKRLANSYPLFAHAAFLLGCCQMQVGQYAEAAEHLEHARLLDMTEEEHDRVVRCLSEARKQLQIIEQQKLQDQKNRRSDKNNRKNKSAKRNITKNSSDDDLEQIISEDEMAASVISSIPGTGAQILQPTGRRQRVRMASEKEKQDVMRRADFPEQEETHIVFETSLFERMRRFIPIFVIVLGIGLLVWGGFMIAGLIGREEQSPDMNSRLEWLEGRLGDLANDNDEVLPLLQEYNEYINPVDDSSHTSEPTEPSTKPTVSEATTTTTTTALETTTESTIAPEDLERQRLLTAYETYTEAFEIQSQDIFQAADLLKPLSDEISDIPDARMVELQDEASSDIIAIVSSQLKEDIDSLYASVATTAADSLRLSGRKLFSAGDYEASLADYLQAYGYDPDNYNGHVAYYCGRCYQELEKYDEAKPYFEYVVENFPNGELAGYAANRLSSMGF